MPPIALSYALAFCRVVIGLVFLVSSVGKLLDMAQFKQAINNFRILPSKFSGLAATLFLCAEMAIFLLVLIGGPLLIVGFSLAIFLLLLFCLALMSVLIRKMRTSCNCFGANTKQVSFFDLWRNIGFIACALVGWGTTVWTKYSQTNPTLIEWVLIGLGAVVFVVIWIQLEEVVQLLQKS